MPRTPPEHNNANPRFLDLSETSFQIPGSIDDEASCLKDTEFDFDAFDDDTALDGDPFATPPPKIQMHRELNLRDLTPHVGSEMGMTERNARSSVVQRDAEAVNQREIQSSVRPLPQNRAPVDDFFERRKRDNYLQMGIDLSAKSTARYRNDENLNIMQQDTEVQLVQEEMPEIFVDDSAAEGCMDVDKEVPPTVVEVEHHKVAAQVPQPKTSVKPKSKGRASPMIRDAGIVKQKARVPSAPIISRPKSIKKKTKAAALPESALKRSLDKASHSSDSDVPKLKDIVPQDQQRNRRRDSAGSALVALGGGIFDVLVTYGEKLRDSLGFSSSTKSTRSPSGSASAHSKENSSSTVSGGSPSSKLDTLTLSQLTPSRKRAREMLALSQSPPLNPSLIGGDGVLSTQPSPMHPSTKRASSSTFPRQNKKGRTDENSEMDMAATSTTAGFFKENPRSKSDSVSKKLISGPKPLGNSNNLNRAAKSNTLPGRSQQLGRVDSVRNRVNVPAPVDPRRVVASLSSRAGLVSISDVYRQLVTERQKDKKRETVRQIQPQRSKSVSHFMRPAPPARPTARAVIPTALKSQIQVVQSRNPDFEARKQAWEARSSTTSSNASQNGTIRKKRPALVLPTEAPVLTTMIRAKEREKFDAERREREKAMEIQRQIRERERAEQEEREYREARKRTVIRANEIPEWYRDVPRRKEVD